MTNDAPLVSTPYYSAVQLPGQSNRVFVRFSQNGATTDATAARYPSTERKELDKDGGINCYQIADDKAIQEWKQELGEFVAEHVVKPAVLARGQKWTSQIMKSTLVSFPEDYQLFVHLKGDRHAPRKDYYLFGSKHVSRFRSPNEFKLHLLWLMEGQAKTSSGKRCCKCVWCDPDAKQSDINRRIASLHQPQAHPGPRRQTHAERHKRLKISQNPTKIKFKNYSKMQETGEWSYDTLELSK